MAGIGGEIFLTVVPYSSSSETSDAISAEVCIKTEGKYILKNCLEHTPEGGTLSLGTEDNPIYTALVIRDTGTGIDREDLPHIFERFYKGKNSSPDSVGIGLAMAKEIIGKQGGEITVKSTPGEGTEFKVKFYRLMTV